MTTSDSDRNRTDLPWQDSPDDDAIVPGAMEPDPAEVVGDENPRDLAGRPIQDPNVRESLDERLSEEEPEGGSLRPDTEEVQLLAGESGETDGLSAEQDNDGSGARELGAEEAAVHIVDEQP